MAAATYDMSKKVVPAGKAVRQATRHLELVKRVDFTKQSLAAGEDATIGMTIPAGFVLDRVDPILRTAEGETSTMHIGIEADDDSLAVSVNMNGTTNARAAIGSPAYTAGAYFHTDTPVRVKCPAAANTINVAIIDIVLTGYMIEASLEYGSGGAAL